MRVPVNASRDTLIESMNSEPFILKSIILCRECGLSVSVSQASSHPTVPDSLLRSYYSSDLTQSAAAEVHSTIPTALSRAVDGLARYDVHVSRLAQTLLELKAERDKLHSNMCRYKYLLSPVRRMPVETLTEIFSYCCCEDVDQPNPALSLSSVCVRRQDIIVAAPRLWSYIWLDLRSQPPPYDFYFTQHDICIKRNLQQLKDLPLYIRLCMPGTDSNDMESDDSNDTVESDEAYSLLRFVIKHSAHRWLRLTIKFST